MARLIYGVEQSTDARDPRTKIMRFRSEGVAREWAAGGGGFTYADPAGARNFHHSFRALFTMPKGWRPPTAARLDRMARHASTRDYPVRREDELARCIRTAGNELHAPASPAGEVRP